LGRPGSGLPFSYEEETLSHQPSTSELCLYLAGNRVPNFFQLLQQGFRVKAQTGCSIKFFLCDQLGFDPEYVENRIQTLFLGGKPVDDTKTAIIRDGSTLALSAAMPGFAGRVLRRGGRFASLRSTISYREKSGKERLQEGVVTLKLFNLLRKEMGPFFLKRGVWIQGKDLDDLLKRESDDFWTGVKKAIVDGKERDLKRLSRMKWAGKEVFLQLISS